MGTIVCATRGGEASYQAQDAAIALARERGEQVGFVYVVDTSFLNHTAAPLVVNVETRLERMGHFQLAVAQERAAEQGISAGAVVRRGSLLSELVRVTRELGAELIGLGHPMDRDAILDEDTLHTLSDRLRSETDAEVFIV